MGGICYLCKSKMGWTEGITRKQHYEFDQIPPKDMTENDKMCRKCYAEDHGGHEQREQDNGDVDDFIETASESSTNSPISGGNTPVTETKPMTKTVSASLSEITSVSTLTNITDQRHNEFKAMWQKGRVVQFKNDKIAILMRAHNSQVQFIVAFDQVTREGFRLMAIDEGKEASAGGFTGGVSSYYYFQKMDFVR